MSSLHPLFLRLAGKDVLVVGAGDVGARKIDELVRAGARVRVIAIEATPAVRARGASGEIALATRAFAPLDVEGAWLVIAATSDPACQREIAAAAEARRVFVVAVDDLANATAYGAATIHRAPLTVAISSSGELPALVRLLRELFEELLPGEEWIDRARELRAAWRASRVPMGERFAALVRDFARRRGDERGGDDPRHTS
jgi:uroporphyrin-III C-methyltransferase/precorrin-2 dehydrogenase/sirohydrochlorin ferrochelatase